MTKCTFYSADDVKTPFKRASKAPKPTKLSAKITPGTVLILLTGRFKGRRVVFIKQLKSGLLLVTGPYKINGVPLKRISKSYVIPTSTKVKVNAADYQTVTDEYFVRAKVQGKRGGDNAFFEREGELSAVEKGKIQKKKENQVKADAALVKEVKSVELLANYLVSRFTIRSNTLPHELKF